MPNLKDIIDDPAKRADSVERMMSGAYRRAEVAINHGVRNTAELDELVRGAPGVAENVAAYHRIIDQQHDGQRKPAESA